jgi:hypothetical protein
VDITAVVVLNETPLQATVSSSPGQGGGDALTSGTLAQFAATTSAQLRGVISDETGTGSLVFANSPTLVSPALGTPSSATLTNATGLPLATGVTGLLPVANGGTGTATPALVAGANVTISGTWPNQTIAAAGGGGGGGSGTVTSVGLVVPTGFSVSGSPVTVSGNITLSYDAGYSLPSNTSQANWDTAYTDRLRWDGGSTGLVAATGRTSLGLGSAATSDATAYATAAQGGKADTAVQPATLTSELAGKADLVSGVVPTSQIPAIAISEYLGAVGSQAAMLGLTGQRGDWCLRTDGLPNTGQWILGADNAALLSSWVQVPLPTVPVQSVNGQAGVIVLGTGDLAESGNLFFTAARAIGAALTGFTSGAGTVGASDSILQALQKVVGNIAERALGGLIGSSGLTMATNRLAGRGTAGVGAVEEITPAGGLSIQSGNLVMTEGIVLTISNNGETAVSRNNYEEKAVDRACTVVGVTLELNPTTVSTSGSSQVMLFARRSGTKTNLLSANASLPVTTGIFTNVSGTLTGNLTLAGGDSVGADLIQVGTGATGLKLTVYVRYS